MREQQEQTQEGPFYRFRRFWVALVATVIPFFALPFVVVLVTGFEGLGAWSMGEIFPEFFDAVAIGFLIALSVGVLAIVVRAIGLQLRERATHVGRGILIGLIPGIVAAGIASPIAVFQAPTPSYWDEMAIAPVPAQAAPVPIQAASTYTGCCSKHTGCSKHSSSSTRQRASCSRVGFPQRWRHTVRDSHRDNGRRLRERLCSRQP